MTERQESTVLGGGVGGGDKPRAAGEIPRGLADQAVGGVGGRWWRCPRPPAASVSGSARSHTQVLSPHLTCTVWLGRATFLFISELLICASVWTVMWWGRGVCGFMMREWRPLPTLLQHLCGLQHSNTLC